MIIIVIFVVIFVLVLMIQSIIVPTMLFLGAYHAHDKYNARSNRILDHDIIVSTTTGVSLSSFTVGTGSKLIIYFHGNSGSLRHDWQALVQEMHTRLLDKGLDTRILVYDYRGYGKSEGVPSVNNTCEDACEVTNYALGKYKPTELYLYGRSLGGAVAMHVAAQMPHEVNGVMLETPFFGTHGITFPCVTWLPETFPCGDYIKVLRHKKIRVTVFLAMADEIISWESAIQFFKAERIVPFRATHNEVFANEELWTKSILEHLLNKEE